MLSTLDSVESTVLEIYKYVLIVGLVLASAFIGWLFINAHNDAARSFPQFYFGAGYLLLVVWVVGNLVMIKRRQARRALAAIAQTASPAFEPAIRASVNPAPPADIKASSQSGRMTPLGLTSQEIVMVIMVFLFVAGTFSVILLMLWVFPRWIL
jgi:hypothetical protein